MLSLTQMPKIHRVVCISNMCMSDRVVLINFNSCLVLNVPWMLHCCYTLLKVKRSKVKNGIIALNGSPFQSYGASPALWDPTVLPATRHK